MNSHRKRLFIKETFGVWVKLFITETIKITNKFCSLKERKILDVLRFQISRIEVLKI